MLEELKSIKSTKKELREFGLVVGGILAGFFGGIALWRGKEIYVYFIAIGSALMALGFFAPFVLKPLQKAWMGFAVIIGFFMSRVVLFILFIFVLTPMGIITRILGKDILDQRINKNAASYWHKRKEEIKDVKSYENQY